MDLTDFDPHAGEPLTAAAHQAYPDATALIAESEIENDGKKPDSGYFIARVPKTPVYVLYGVDDAEHVVIIVAIRTWEPAN